MVTISRKRGVRVPIQRGGKHVDPGLEVQLPTRLPQHLASMLYTPGFPVLNIVNTNQKFINKYTQKTTTLITGVIRTITLKFYARNNFADPR